MVAHMPIAMPIPIAHGCMPIAHPFYGAHCPPVLWCMVAMFSYFLLFMCNNAYAIMRLFRCSVNAQAAMPGRSCSPESLGLSLGISRHHVWTLASIDSRTDI